MLEITVPELCQNPTFSWITKSTDPERRKIVSELIAMLNGKNILNNSEAMGLLRKLTK